MEGLLFQTSLIAAFVAGMVALFAPCCITFLLPAYLGSVFKEREKVLLMTMVFGLGIFVVLLPAVLGVAFISKMLFRYHDVIYIIGGSVILFMAPITLLGLKLPMPHLPGGNPQKVDVLSIFSLGIVSGITSACCAPVLIGILALTFLTPSFFGALTIGAMYVLGMVTPLLLISLFITDKMPKFTALRKPFTAIKMFGEEYPVPVGNLVASIIFLLTGMLTLELTLTGRLSMEGMSGATKTIQNVGGYVNGLFGQNMIFNILFVGFVAYFLYKISKRI